MLTLGESDQCYLGRRPLLMAGLALPHPLVLIGFRRRACGELIGGAGDDLTYGVEQEGVSGGAIPANENLLGHRGDTMSRIMRNLSVATLIALSLVSAGCGGSTGSPSSSSSISATHTSATAAPSTIRRGPVPNDAYDRLCASLTWPRQVPAVVGLLDHEGGGEGLGPLDCVHVVAWVRPNGSPAGLEAASRIVAVSPAPGTAVGPHDPITLTVVPVQPDEPPGNQPCDWVSTTEASRFLGGTPVTTHIPEPGKHDTLEDSEAPQTPNVAGSTDLWCSYNSSDNSHMVSTELLLTGAQIVDAATEFHYMTELYGDSVSVDGVGIKAECVLGDRPDLGDLGSVNKLWVLLPGERIYILSGWTRESCDTLKQFAQAAIPRIGA
jgi:hypothetical protein